MIHSVAPVFIALGLLVVAWLLFTAWSRWIARSRQRAQRLRLERAYPLQIMEGLPADDQTSPAGSVGDDAESRCPSSTDALRVTAAGAELPSSSPAVAPPSPSISCGNHLHFGDGLKSRITNGGCTCP